MKLAILFVLSLCGALATASYHSSDLTTGSDIKDLSPFGIKDIVDKVLKFIKEAVEKLAEKASEIVSKITEGIDRIINEILNSLLDVVKKIKDIAKTGIVAKNCAKPHEQRIEEIMNEMQSNINECRQIALAEASQIKANIEESISQIQSLLKEMYQMITDCLKNEGVGAALCIAGKVGEIKEKVQVAYQVAEKVIADAQERVPQIIEESKMCVQAAQEKPTEEMNEILRKIQKCISDNTIF